MRKVIILVLLSTIQPLLFGAIFSGYDFTFFPTVSDSLMSTEGDNLGVDYTGYGFIGQESKTGIYLRIGLQAPYSSLISIFSPPDMVAVPAPEPGGDGDSLPSTDTPGTGLPDSTLPAEPVIPDTPSSGTGNQPGQGDGGGSSAPDIDEDPEDIEENLERSFTVSFNIGPAFRKFIGDEAMWYFGLGMAFRLDYNDMSSSETQIQRTTMNMDFGFDADMGIRIDVAGQTTLRIGVHAQYTFFSLQIASSTPRSNEAGLMNNTSITMVPNLFLREGEMEPLSAQGYISLGHTFRPADNEIRYRYITTSPEPFRGRRMAIDEDQDPLSSLTSITSASVGLGM